MQQKNYDLKINILTSDYKPPESSGYKNIWFNLYGIEEADQELVQYLGKICQDNERANKLLINANEKIKEQLEVFSRVHGAEFIK